MGKGESRKGGGIVEREVGGAKQVCKVGGEGKGGPDRAIRILSVHNRM